jgi:hypothetical protein
VAQPPHHDLALEGAAVVCKYQAWGICVRERSKCGRGARDEKRAVNMRGISRSAQLPSVGHGDALELVYILTAGSPRETCKISPESGKLTSIGEVRRFQLSHAPSVTFTTSPVVYGRARVRGKVSVGMTAHYHAPAAIGVVDFHNGGEWSPPWSLGTSGLIPLTVSSRRAEIGPALVAEVKNQSKLTLGVLVGIANPTTHKTRKFAIILPPFRKIISAFRRVSRFRRVIDCCSVRQPFQTSRCWCRSDASWFPSNQLGFAGVPQRPGFGR